MSTKICKVCGKEYEACKPVYTQNVYRWQDVACCKEHGAEYFAMIEQSRKHEKIDDAATSVVTDNDVEYASTEVNSPNDEGVEVAKPDDVAPARKKRKRV